MNDEPWISWNAVAWTFLPLALVVILILAFRATHIERPCAKWEERTVIPGAPGRLGLSRKPYVYKVCIEGDDQ